MGAAASAIDSSCVCHCISEKVEEEVWNNNWVCHISGMSLRLPREINFKTWTFWWKKCIQR